MTKTKELEIHCPKCGTFCSGPILSPSTNVERIDKIDTQIIITAVIKTNLGMEIIKSPLPAWGYTCQKCGLLFAVSQLTKSGTYSNEEIAKMIHDTENKSEEVK